MDDRLTRRLLDRKQSSIARMIGKVTVVDPLTVTYNGVARECLHLDSCSPRVNDRVWISKVGNEPPVVLGVISDVDEISPATNTGGNWSGTVIARIVSGRVFLDGQVGRSSGSNNTICTLPTGFRPAYAMYLGVETLTQRGAINVLTTGEVNYLAGLAASMFLDGSNFRL